MANHIQIREIYPSICSESGNKATETYPDSDSDEFFQEC